MAFQGGDSEEVFLGDVTWTLATSSTADAGPEYSPRRPLLARAPRRKRVSVAALDVVSAEGAQRPAKQPRVSERVRLREAGVVRSRDAEQSPTHAAHAQLPPAAQQVPEASVQLPRVIIQLSTAPRQLPPNSPQSNNSQQLPEQSPPATAPVSNSRAATVTQVPASPIPELRAANVAAVGAGRLVPEGRNAPVRPRNPALVFDLPTGFSVMQEGTAGSPGNQGIARGPQNPVQGPVNPRHLTPGLRSVRADSAAPPKGPTTVLSAPRPAPPAESSRQVVPSAAPPPRNAAALENAPWDMSAQLAAMVAAATEMARSQRSAEAPPSPQAQPPSDDEQPGGTHGPERERGHSLPPPAAPERECGYSHVAKLAKAHAIAERWATELRSTLARAPGESASGGSEGQESEEMVLFLEQEARSLQEEVAAATAQWAARSANAADSQVCHKRGREAIV